MYIRYNIEKIKEIVDNLYGLTGLSLGFLDTNNVNIYERVRDNDEVCVDIQSTAEGRARCLCSDTSLVLKCKNEKKPISHICHAGLLDTAVPIIKNHSVVGIFIIGRIIPNLADSEENKKLRQRYPTMRSFTDEQLDSLINLISNIIFENAIDVDCNDLIVRALEYIDKNLASDLSITNLCNSLYVSRNSLYKSFHNHFGCTVNEYITRRRINKAAVLLRESRDSITTIAESVGIHNYTYFSRLFKKNMAMSPIQYRKKQ